MVSDRGMIDEIVAITSRKQSVRDGASADQRRTDTGIDPQKRFRKINPTIVVKEVIDSLRSAPRNDMNTRGIYHDGTVQVHRRHMSLDWIWRSQSRDIFRREAITWGSMTPMKA